MHIDALSSTNTQSPPIKKKSSSFKMKLKEYLVEQNVRPTDVAKVLLAFKLCAWSTWVVLVPICGKLRPIRRLGQMSGPRRLKSWFIKTYPNRYESWEEHIIKGSEWIAKRKSIRWIPDAFGQRHRDFGLSIAEATVLYKVNYLLYVYVHRYFIHISTLIIHINIKRFYFQSGHHWNSCILLDFIRKTGEFRI